MKALKKLPKFKSEQEEKEFWEKSDTADYFDLTHVQSIRFPNLKKSTKTISLRLPEDMLEKIKVKANALDVPYQSYIKMLLDKELAH